MFFMDRCKCRISISIWLKWCSAGDWSSSSSSSSCAATSSSLLISRLKRIGRLVDAPAARIQTFTSPFTGTSYRSVPSCVSNRSVCGTLLFNSSLFFISDFQFVSDGFNSCTENEMNVGELAGCLPSRKMSIMKKVVVV